MPNSVKLGSDQPEVQGGRVKGIRGVDARVQLVDDYPGQHFVDENVLDQSCKTYFAVTNAKAVNPSLEPMSETILA